MEEAAPNHVTLSICYGDGYSLGPASTIVRGKRSTPGNGDARSGWSLIETNKLFPITWWGGCWRGVREALRGGRFPLLYADSFFLV